LVGGNLPDLLGRHYDDCCIADQGPLRHALSAAPEDSTRVLAAGSAEAEAASGNERRDGIEIRVPDISFLVCETLLSPLDPMALIRYPGN
jgi:hypothetical protein